MEINERVYLQDIYPTLLELAGVEVPDYIEFRSLNALMDGTADHSPYESIYMAMFDDQRGMILNDYKLILYPQAEEAELYNLAGDPWELKNLVDRPESAEVLRQMGVEFANRPDVNMLFARLTDEAADRLEAAGVLFYRIAPGLIRLVTSWQTTSAEVDAALAEFRKVLDR